MQSNQLPKVIFIFLLLLGGSEAFSQSTTLTFNYTGSVQSFTVPPCVTTITVTAKGAQGGAAAGGAGGLGSVVTATFAVVPGQVLQVRVGGAGSAPGAGYNGGGSGGLGYSPGGNSGGGGGASDVRIAPYALGNRIIVAAGGGGSSAGTPAYSVAGGAGGCVNGVNGPGSPFTGTGGTGGTQTAGGTGGPNYPGGQMGQNGSLGLGGNGGFWGDASGGGGGGGYFGGGGGGSDGCCSGANGGAAGGGGSCLVPFGGTCSGTNSGNGVVQIIYTSSAIVPTATNTGPYCPGVTGQLNCTPTGVGYTYSWAGPNGFTSAVQNPTIPNVSSFSAGAYTVTISSGSCATATVSTTVVVNATPTLTVSNTGPYCTGNTIQLNAAGATSYSWTGPLTYTSNVQNPTISNATTAMTGVYTVTGTIGTCTSSLTTSVTVNPIPTVTATNTGPYCPNAIVQLNSSGATTYSWTGPSTYTSNIQNPSPGVATSAISGVYTVVGTANNCTASATTTVTIGNPPAPILSSNSPVCEGATLNINCANGSTWSWAGPNGYSSSSQNISFPAATPSVTGTYTATITDTQGCTSTDTISVVVNPLPVVTVTSDSICSGQATATLIASGASSYSWTGNPTPNNTATVTASPTVTTTYDVTGTDINGCQSTVTATVTVFASPTVTVNSPAICLGSTATLNAAGASSYAWTAGTTPGNSATETATPTVTTQYTVTGTDANGCTSSAISTVTVNYSPVFDAGANDTVCVGDMVNLIATGPVNATYTWNGTMVGQTQSFSAASTDTYTLVCVDANGCTGTDSVLITVPAPIVLNAAGFATTCNSVCDGQLVVIPSPSTGPFSTYTYNWVNGNYTTASVITACAGTYTVTVTNNAGCTETATATVTEPAAMTASSSNITPASCNGACDGSVTIISSGGTGTHSYSWSSLGTGANPNNLCAGSYTCTVTDVNNCAVTVPVTISQPAAISAAIGSVNTICIGQSTTLNASATGGNGGYVYTWTGGTTPTSGASVSASPTSTSSYSVSVTDANGCPAGTATVSVTVNPPLTVVASNDVTICSGQSTSLSANASGGNGSYVYTWTGGPAPASGQTISTAPLATSTYTVTLTDGCGTPSASDMVTVTVNPLPTLGITVSPQDGCEPVCATFSVMSTPAAATVNWTFTNGTVSNGQNPNVCFMNDGDYGATINVTDVNGCQNTLTSNNLVTVFPVPDAEFWFSPQPASIANPIVNFEDHTVGGTIVSWGWTFGVPGASSTEQNPYYSYVDAGNYEVQLSVMTDEGCVDTVTHTVVIDQEFMLYVPNAFSPNGDGINDYFFPQGMGVISDDFQISIFDRWGNMIYSDTDWNEPWDGKVNGNVVQEDVYVWKIQLRTWERDKKVYVGHVTVVK